LYLVLKITSSSKNIGVLKFKRFLKISLTFSSLLMYAKLIILV
jgi:hypothetical protein